MLDKKRQEALDALRGEHWTPGPTAQDVLDMERELLEKPGDIRLRCELLEYYGQRRTDKAAGEKHFAHLMWLIEDHSTLEPLRYATPHELYTPLQIGEIRKHVREQLTRSPISAELHGYAAKFVAESDEERIAFLREAQQLATDEFWYHRELVGLFYQKAKNASGSERSEFTALAIAEADKAIRLKAPRGEVIGIYVDLMPLAFQSGAVEKAEEYAKNLLTIVDSTPYDWYKQTAQLMLARVALVREAPDEAKVLLASALDSLVAASSTARLNLAGSNRFMVLLDELLHFGERDCVLKALETSLPFCTAEKQTLMNRWLDELRSGQTPKLRFDEPD